MRTRRATDPTAGPAGTPAAPADPEALAVYHRNAALVPHILKRYFFLLDTHECDELLQTGWVELWRLASGGKYDPSIAKESTYFGRFILYAGLKKLREFARSRRRRTVQIERIKEPFGPSGPDLLEQADAVAAVLAVVTERQRFILNGIRQGMTFPQLGKAMGISVERVKQLKAAAVARVRQRLPQLSSVADARRSSG